MSGQKSEMGHCFKSCTLGIYRLLSSYLPLIGRGHELDMDHNKNFTLGLLLM